MSIYLNNSFHNWSKNDDWCLDEKGRDLTLSLDIYSSDDVKNFHIGYFGFTKMRSLFILSKCGMEVYEDYRTFIEWIMRFNWSGECPIDTESFDDAIGDLLILINHSDCDGELSSLECVKLLPCLSVDEEAIKKTEVYKNNPEHTDRMITSMYNFIDLIGYCAEHKDVRLIFG